MGNAFNLEGRIGVDTTPLRQGLAQAEGTVKGFAGQVSGIGNALGVAFGAYTVASIAGATLELGKFGAQAMRLETSFKAMAKAPDALIASLKAASGATISTGDLMLASNRAIMLGLGSDAEKMGQLMEVARFKGRAMGLSTAQAYSDMITGVGRMSPEILDNLGIVVDATATYGAYAASIGRSVESLTAMEKKNALANRVIAEGMAQIKAAGGTVDDAADAYERLAAAQADLSATTGRIVAPFTSELVSNAATFAKTLEQILTLGSKYGVYKTLDIYGAAIFGGPMPSLPPGEPGKRAGTGGWEAGFAPHETNWRTSVLGLPTTQERHVTMAEQSMTWADAYQKFAGDPDAWNAFVQAELRSEAATDSGASAIRILATDTRTLAQVMDAASKATGGWATQVQKGADIFSVGGSENNWSKLVKQRMGEDDVIREDQKRQAVEIKRTTDEAARAGKAYWQDLASKAKEAQDRIQGFISFTGSPSYRGGLVGTSSQMGNAWDERARRIEDIGNLAGASPWAAGETGWQGLNDPQRQAWAQMQAANIRERPSIANIGPEGVAALTQDAIRNIQSQVDKEALYKEVQKSILADPVAVANMERLGINVKDAFAEPSDKIASHVDSGSAAIVAAIGRLPGGGGGDGGGKGKGGMTPAQLAEFQKWNVPVFASGGYVPGRGPVPIIADGGELILNPRQQAAMGGTTITINNPVFKVDNPRGFLAELNNLMPTR